MARDFITVRNGFCVSLGASALFGSRLLDNGPRDFSNLGELSSTRRAALPAKVGGASAIGEGVCLAHDQKLDREEIPGAGKPSQAPGKIIQGESRG